MGIRKGRGWCWLRIIALSMAVVPVQAAEICEPIPDMFCVSQQVESLYSDRDAETANKMFVYRFHDKKLVDIAHGNPPITQTEKVRCVEGRTYKSFLLYSFSADWRKGVAAFVDPGMSTIEFLNCVPEE